MYSSAITLLFLAVSARLGHANPAATPAPQLVARSADPSVIGYFSASNGYSDGRTCDYPSTVSTSGSYAQCCGATGACNFFTGCSGNTLVGGAATAVACDDGICNTAVLLATAGAKSGASNLACWQNSLGSSAFTLVQDIGSATVAPAATTGTASSGMTAATSGSSRASSPSSSAGGNSAAGGAASSSPSKAAAAAAAAGFDNALGNGGMLAAAMAAIQALL